MIKRFLKKKKKMKNHTQENTRYYFVVSIILIAIFFINVLFINDRRNNFEIKKIIQNYEIMIEQIKSTNERAPPIASKIDLKKQIIETTESDIERNFDEKKLLQTDIWNKEKKSEYWNKIPILIMCYNRPDYLEKTINNLLKYFPKDSNFFLIISQDGNDQKVKDMIENKLSKLIYKETLFHYIQVCFLLNKNQNISKTN